MVFNNRTLIYFLFAFACLFQSEGRVAGQEIKSIEIAPTWIDLDSFEAPAFEAAAQSVAVAVVESAPNEATNADSENLAWVWDEPLSEHDNPEQPRFFRLTFELDSAPNLATEGNSVLQITADDTYTLYVNGQEIERDEKDDKWEAIRRVPISNRLRSGKNVIGIRALNRNGGPAGVIALLRVFTKANPNQANIVKTNGHTKVCATDQENWTSVDFDDSQWAAAVVVGAPTDKPWEIVKQDPNRERNRLLRETAKSRVELARGANDTNASLAIIQLAHLAADFGTVNLLEPPREFLDLAVEPKRLLQDVAVDVVSEYMRHQCFERRTAAWNGYSVLTTAAGRARDTSLLEKLLSSSLTQFQFASQQDNLFQSVVLGRLRTTLDADLATFRSSASEIMELEKSIATMSEQLTDKNKELADARRKLAKQTSSIAMKEGERENKKNEVQALPEAEDRTAVQKTQFIELNQELKAINAQLASLSISKGALENMITTLLLEVDRVTRDELKAKSAATERLAKLNSANRLILARANLISGFANNACRFMQSEVGRLACQSLQSSVQGNILVYNKINSLQTAATFINESGAAGGTVTLIEGNGAPTSASHRPTATDLPTVGSRPGVSNTAPFDPTANPGQRDFREDVTPAEESAVENAPGGAGAEGGTGGVSPPPPAAPPETDPSDEGN